MMVMLLVVLCRCCMFFRGGRNMQKYIARRVLPETITSDFLTSSNAHRMKLKHGTE